MTWEKQKIDPLTIEITINERRQCRCCKCNIYQLIEDHFILDCEQHHSF